ncbi:MAG: hypothetical protein LBU67_05820 [Oscillospiraceae bacterium]|jgi:pilin isopeptide linkage protein|nr:hypothetical protein [Oscillospiraceae bacterium]
MTYNVHDQASLNAALAGSDVNIDIIVTDSFTMTSPAIVHLGKIVTMTSGAGGPYTITQGTRVTGGLIQVPNTASLTLANLVIDGNKGAVTANGPLVFNEGILTLNDGAVLQNNGNNPASGGRGGAIYNINMTALLTMNGGAITGNTANYGGGVYNQNGRFFMNGGDISGNTASAWGGGVFNFGGTFAMAGGAITGNSAGTDGGGIYQTANTALNITGNSEITNNAALGGSGGGIWIAYANLANLNIGPNVTFAGNSASAAYDRNPIDDPAYFAHIEGTHWTVPFTQGYNNYDIAYTRGNVLTLVSLTGQKSAAGAPLTDGQFQFGIYDESGNLVTTATNDAAGNISFQPIAFVAGQVPGPPAPFCGGAFTVRELTPSGGGWATDSTVYPVYVFTEPDASGSCVATSAIALIDYPNGAPAFVNTYLAAPANVNLAAQKSAVGAPLPASRFTFAVFGENGSPVVTAANDANGRVNFPALAFTAPGVYSYTIRETTPPGGGWAVDTRAYQAVVTVTDNGQGQLVTSVNYPQGMPAFVNTYGSAHPATVTLAATKTLGGACLFSGMFTFGVFDQNSNEIARAANDGSGHITFPAITLDQPGVYMYTVRELNPSGGGWVMDSRAFPVSVAVTDNGSGQLIASVGYPQGKPSFTNTYCQPCPPMRCHPCPPARHFR